MAQRYFNSAVVRDKEQSWRQFINEMFGPADVSISDESKFHGDIRCSSLGDLSVTTIKSSYEYGERTRSHMLNDTNEHFVFVLLKSGRLQIKQRNRECTLSPGTFTLFDCNLPYTFHHTEPTEVLDVSIPSNIIRLRLRDPHRFVVKARSAEVGLGRIMSDLLGSLSNELSRIPEDIAVQFSNQIADMMGILLESESDDFPIGNSAVQTAIYRRSTAFIEYNLADPELNPAKRAGPGNLHRALSGISA